MHARLTYGRTTEDWELLERECLRFLVEHARLGGGRTTTYTKLNTVLVNRTGLPGFDVDDQAGRAAIGELLGQVVDRAMATYSGFNKLMISCLAAYFNENDAGRGSTNWLVKKQLLQPGADRLTFWAMQVHAVEHYFENA